MGEIKKPADRSMSTVRTGVTGLLYLSCHLALSLSGFESFSPSAQCTMGAQMATDGVADLADF